MEPKSVTQIEAYEAGVQWARTEGSVPAPETNHALAQVIKEANKAKEEGKEKVILANFSGHGMLDLSAYEKFLDGKLEEVELPAEVLERAAAVTAQYPKPEIIR